MESMLWQFEATEACTTRTQMQEREQESIAVVDYEDHSTTETIEAYDAVKGSIQRKCERDETKRCESLTNSKSKWWSTNQRCE